MSDNPTPPGDVEEPTPGVVAYSWETPPPLLVEMPPPTLTRRQLRLGLLSLGATVTQVETAISALPDATAREEALIEWQDASSYLRSHPLVAQIAGALGFTAEQIDAAWAAAATR